MNVKFKLIKSHISNNFNTFLTRFERNTLRMLLLRSFILSLKVTTSIQHEDQIETEDGKKEEGGVRNEILNVGTGNNWHRWIALNL